MKVLKVVQERVYRAGYIVRKEKWEGPDGQPVLMTSAYTIRGAYIGTPRLAARLTRKYGIQFHNLRPLTRKVIATGYNPIQRKWYGWSHRAIYGFGVGSVVSKGSTISKANGGPFPTGFRAKTLADAANMADAFAESVS